MTIEYRTVYFIDDGRFFNTRQEAQIAEQILELTEFVGYVPMAGDFDVSNIISKLLKKYDFQQRYDWKEPLLSTEPQNIEVPATPQNAMEDF